MLEVGLNGHSGGSSEGKDAERKGGKWRPDLRLIGRSTGSWDGVVGVIFWPRI